MATGIRAQRAAILDYRADSARLQDEARMADDTGRPLLARKRRYWAIVAHRAAHAELTDPKPKELP